MSLRARFNFDNDYRNPSFQQTGTITLPGATMALHDMTGTLVDALQRQVSTELTAVEQAQFVKVYMNRGVAIRDKVNKYPPRGGVPKDLADTLSAIEASYSALCGVFSSARSAAQNELLCEAGL